MLSPEHREILLEIAEHSILEGLRHGRALHVEVDRYPPELRLQRATFVTLHRGSELRGCIGSLEAYQPLVQNVAQNAYAAAFSDPRFPPLAAPEYAGLHLDVSVLSPAEPMSFTSEQDLLAQLRPGVDGLILEDRGHRGTFLPSVWESLPTPALFLRQLKAKAWLPTDHWSATLRVSRYTTEYFGRPVNTAASGAPAA